MGEHREIPDELIERLIERAAGAELEQDLGYAEDAEAPERQPNRRKGRSAKTPRPVDGPLRRSQATQAASRLQEPP